MTDTNEIMNALTPGVMLHGASYNYRIERVLGQGTFGITYLASVKMTGALGSIDANVYVALKEFFMREINGRENSTVTSGSKEGLYMDYQKKFVREAQNLAKLQHPNIIKVIESFEENNTVYYVMEYMDGGSLDERIAKKHGLIQSQVLEYTRQIGAALSFMHQSGMLHLDVKPSNIMLQKGKAVLIDFGLSKQYDSNGMPESSTRVGGGTPGYAPIEQSNYRDGKGFPVTMDVYALGATMFKMLTGKRPPEASDVLNEGFPTEELERLDIGIQLRNVLVKAMSPLRKDRYQSIEELLRDCDKINSEETDVDVVSASQVNYGTYKKVVIGGDYQQRIIDIHRVVEDENVKEISQINSNNTNILNLLFGIVGLTYAAYIAYLEWHWIKYSMYIYCMWGIDCVIIVLSSLYFLINSRKLQMNRWLWLLVFTPFLISTIIVSVGNYAYWGHGIFFILLGELALFKLIITLTTKMKIWFLRILLALCIVSASLMIFVVC